MAAAFLIRANFVRAPGDVQRRSINAAWRRRAQSISREYRHPRSFQWSSRAVGRSRLLCVCVCVCVDQPGHERIHKRASSRPAGQINRPAVRRTAGHRRRGGRTRRRPALFNASTATTRRRDGRRRRRRLPPAAPRPATPWLAVCPPARRSVSRLITYVD